MSSTPNEPPAASRPNPAATPVWSIVRQLTLLFVASTATLLLLSGGFLYWTLKRNLDHTRHGLLASKIEVLRLLLREQPENTGVLASEVEHEASQNQPMKYYIRVLDEQGAMLLETPGMSQAAPASWFPPPIDVTAELRQVMPARLRHHAALHLLSANATVGNHGLAYRTLQIAMDTGTGNELLRDYRNKLLVVLGLGLAFAALAGVWVARSGMRPLAEITHTAQRITASHLHDRITGIQWPSELAQLAAAFDAMLDRLEHSFTRLSEFSADLAHALRTPLHNLRGEAEVALSRTRTPEEYQHVLASSLEECERLSRMIDGLLFIARADDPKTAVERVRFEARKELEAVREFYEALASEQEVTVTCDGQAWLAADPMLFRRAVSNLLGNALRHTPAKGTVHMSITSVPDGAVHVCVRDTGTGIAPEHLPKIFDRFYRASLPQSAVPGGIGLGLAIVQSIMRLHGGTVHVQSVLRHGTVFTLNFPTDSLRPTSSR